MSPLLTDGALAGDLQRVVCKSCKQDITFKLTACYVQRKQTHDRGIGGLGEEHTRKADQGSRSIDSEGGFNDSDEVSCISQSILQNAASTHL